MDVSNSYKLDRACMSLDILATSSSDGDVSSGWQMVARELIETEKAYVTDLWEIVQGYYRGLVGGYPSPVSKEERAVVFCNINELLDFNSQLLLSLEIAVTASHPCEIASCFLSVAEEFKMYARYCTSFVQANDMLRSLQQRPEAVEYFQKCQVSLGHTLPLDSYLLKPVQRVLKYPLLLSSLAKQYSKSESPVDEIQKQLANAYESMSKLATYINGVKEQYELERITSQVISNIKGWDSPPATGHLLMDDQTRVHGTKELYHAYGFEDQFVVTKPSKNGPASEFKCQLKYAALLLADVGTDENSFELQLQHEHLIAGWKPAKLFPLTVCSRSAKQRTLWLKTLAEKQVATKWTNEQNEYTSGRLPLTSSSSDSPSKPRPTFGSVIAQVQKACGRSTMVYSPEVDVLKTRSPMSPLLGRRLGSAGRERHRALSSAASLDTVVSPSPPAGSPRVASDSNVSQSFGGSHQPADIKAAQPFSWQH